MVVHHANTRGSWLEGHWEPPVLSVTRLSIYNHLKIKSLKNVLYQEKEKDGIEYTHPRSLPAPSVCLCVVTAATGLGGRGAAGLLGKAGTQRAGLEEVRGGGPAELHKEEGHPVPQVSGPVLTWTGLTPGPDLGHLVPPGGCCDPP